MPPISGGVLEIELTPKTKDGTGEETADTRVVVIVLLTKVGRGMTRELEHTTDSS